MRGKAPDRKASSRRGAILVFAALASAMGLQGAAAAEPGGFWDSVLERLNVKAAPAAPAPDFVRRTRTDPADLGYIAPAAPHKVSTIAVKTPAQIEAGKVALDAARDRQLAPQAASPVQLAAPPKPAKAKAVAKE